jgi:hypothetical protein
VFVLFFTYIHHVFLLLLTARQVDIRLNNYNEKGKCKKITLLAVKIFCCVTPGLRQRSLFKLDFKAFNKKINIYQHLAARRIIVCCCFHSCCSHLEHTASVKRFISLQFLNLRHSVGLLGRVVRPSQCRYLTQAQNKHK